MVRWEAFSVENGEQIKHMLGIVSHISLSGYYFNCCGERVLFKASHHISSTQPPAWQLATSCQLATHFQK